MRKITILALNNAVASSVMGTMDILCQAGLTWNYLFGKDPVTYFDVEIVTQDGKPVTCLNQVKIHPSRSAAEVEETEVIIISSFAGFETLASNKGIFEWLMTHYEKGTTLASVCVGSFLLAETGLLDGKIATTHWGFADEFRRRYPQIYLRPERLITEEAGLLCSGACSSYIDLAMYLINRYCGNDVAIESSKAYLHDFGRSSQFPYMVSQFQKGHGDLQILEVQEWIEKNYSVTINISSLAKAHGISQRAFERRFRMATGDTPLRYLQRVRVENAKKILELGNESFNEIAYHVGYEDSSFFRKIFKKYTNLLPSEYRKKFRTNF